MIRHYTREAGVRNLERKIGTICRKQARRMAEGKTEKLVVTPEIVQEFLGGIKIRSRRRNCRAHEACRAWSVGLAWTPAGGDMLFIEANRMKGKGGFTMTGQIGQVMQESMQAALTWVRSNATQLGHRRRVSSPTTIIHIHVPAGAIPKDGPSAGVTMATALVSLLTERPVRPLTGDDRRNHAERQRAADRRREGESAGRETAGVRDVILPAENKTNVEEDLTPEQTENVSVHYVKHD